MVAALRDGDTSLEPAVRELLKNLIDASDGPKLQFWLRAIGMVASKAAAKGLEEQETN